MFYIVNVKHNGSTIDRARFGVSDYSDFNNPTTICAEAVYLYSTDYQYKDMSPDVEFYPASELSAEVETTSYIDAVQPALYRLN